MKYKKVVIFANGNVNSISCHGGLPYYFFEAGEREKIFHAGYNLSIPEYKYIRLLWSFLRLLTFKSYGGFQYSNFFNRYIHYKIRDIRHFDLVISFNQVVPCNYRLQCNVIPYIDATLKDLLDNPAYEVQIPKDIERNIIDIERKYYLSSPFVVTRSTWIHKTLIDFYGISPDKIHHILPGANFNLPQMWKPSEFEEGAGISRPLVLGFVGKDWKRKGLPVLINVKNILKEKGYHVVIKAIGNYPVDLKQEEGVEYSGLIDKRDNLNRFVDIVSSCDIGCLFSTSEALGISTLEFLRVGVPVAGYYHQGLKDTLLEGASFRFGIESTPLEIAREFEYYIRDTELQKRMRSQAWEYSSFVTWDRCVDQWRKIIDTL